jgi:sporulation protein YlmC with PRC-barrel domain
MSRPSIVAPIAAGICLFLAAPLAAAPLPATDPVAQPAPSPENVSGFTPAKACLSELSAFDSRMQKDGFWADDAGFGSGYPMDGYPANSPNDYRNVRPSYELRTLIASANILAERGQQQACEDTLSAIREIYKTRSADMRANGNPEMNGPSRQQLEIAAAQPVTASTNPFRSDQLVGTDVRNAKNENLGSVHDLVMSPSNGAIGYLVIGRGGFFGIDEKYVPVPWSDFKVTRNMSLLVLDVTKGAMDDAPQMTDRQFTAAGQFDQQKQKVDDYWKKQLSSN